MKKETKELLESAIYLVIFMLILMTGGFAIGFVIASHI